jgi:hypothetical protein
MSDVTAILLTGQTSELSSSVWMYSFDPNVFYFISVHNSANKLIDTHQHVNTE